MALLLLHANATVQIMHSKTPERVLQAGIAAADIVVACVVSLVFFCRSVTSVIFEHSKSIQKREARCADPVHPSARTPFSLSPPPCLSQPRPTNLSAPSTLPLVLALQRSAVVALTISCHGRYFPFQFLLMVFISRGYFLVRRLCPID